VERGVEKEADVTNLRREKTKDEEEERCMQPQRSKALFQAARERRKKQFAFEEDPCNRKKAGHLAPPIFQPV